MLDLLFAGMAWAQDGAAPAAAGGGGLGDMLQNLGPMPMLVLMFAVFYFLLIRPQQKKAKAQKELLTGLKQGDQVVTNAGIYGRITGLTDQVVVLEIAPQVRIKMSRAAVAGLAGADNAPAQDKKK
jgi:preprotein translocase subunit YajC